MANTDKEYFDQGNKLRDRKKYSEAVVLFEKAIKINPNYFEAYNNLGTVLIILGKREKAIKNFIKAIEISPKYTRAHFNLAISINFNKESKELKAMELLTKEKDLNKDDQIYLNFALGKANEDLKSYDKAYQYWKLGNDLLRSQYNYSIESDKFFFNNLKNSFYKEIFNEFEKFKLDKTSPIFIVGLPRSGTTLVEQILSSHKDVYGAGEIPFLQNLITEHFKPKENASDKNQKNYLLKNFEIIKKNYLSLIKKNTLGSNRFTDKFPYNFKWIGIIKILFPNAKIINCKRNFKDNCFSIFKTKFNNYSDNQWSSNMEEIVNYFKLYDDLMKHWKIILPNQIYEISYENLVNNSEKEIKEIVDFCGLKWEESLKMFHKNKRTVETASLLQVRKPMYSTSINSWKNYQEQLKDFFVF